ncbi:TetR/AcrR family transcriptional regulator [Maricaulis sp.]|uniref:TetR/AcrR family transcriptional regulator n=1 Tax=Maricaulis sp. TaxID=1486257 RepID=UPI001B065C9B|nr:TetR/AcrR family transcriptional regulator [Maricaulis sp.]MBO6764408.1 TetR family transcriptional regulator [Maricaulis sp.]
MNSDDEISPPGEGKRERKRRETLARITDVGLRLFLQRGYDATTLDEIAAEAGISRRTFFHYFKSKDEILLSLQSDMGLRIVRALEDEPADKPPLEAIRDAVLEVCNTIPADEMLAIDRLMRASPVVQARKLASYVEHEATLYAALRRKWPGEQRQLALRLVSMMSIGALRLSTDAYHREDGARPFGDLLREAFAALGGEANP